VNLDEAERRRAVQEFGVVGLAQADPHINEAHFFIAALASSADLPPILAQVPLAT
jgi:cyclophilin family peptidyl-prolyl cis-trans isomerase